MTTEMYVKEAFMYDGSKIGVVEAKEFLLNRFGVTEDTLVTKNIDTRIMTCIAKLDTSNVITSDNKDLEDLNYLIYVYDYAKLNEDNDINKAILLHELAHIYYPPDSLQQELECDRYASKKVNQQAVYDFLTITLNDMKKLGKPTKDLELRRIAMGTITIREG